jgi:hypothetical protein
MPLQVAARLLAVHTTTRALEFVSPPDIVRLELSPAGAGVSTLTAGMRTALGVSLIVAVALAALSGAGLGAHDAARFCGFVGVALRQANALPEWRQIERRVASAVILTESLRTLDRLRLRAGLSDEAMATRRATILRPIASLELVELDEVVLERAAQPMPTELGTLDALPHVTAALWRDMSHEESRYNDPRHGWG